MSRFSSAARFGFGVVFFLGSVPVVAHAQSVLQAYGRAHDAQFESGRQLGPSASAAQINAARDHDYAQATETFHAEFNRTYNKYTNSAKAALNRFNNSILNMLKGGQAADAVKTPEQLQAGAAQPRRSAPMRPVTAAGGAKGADKVKFGSETSKADPTVVDGIVQDAPTAPPTLDPNVVDGINQDAPAAVPKTQAPAVAAPKPATITPVKPGAVDDSGIVQDR